MAARNRSGAVKGSAILEGTGKEISRDSTSLSTRLASSSLEVDSVDSATRRTKQKQKREWGVKQTTIHRHAKSSQHSALLEISPSGIPLGTTASSISFVSGVDCIGRKHKSQEFMGVPPEGVRSKESKSESSVMADTSVAEVAAFMLWWLREFFKSIFCLCLVEVVSFESNSCPTGKRSLSLGPADPLWLNFV